MTENKRLSFNDVENLDDVRYVVLDIPEWGGQIELGSLTTGEMMEWTEKNDGPAKRTAGLRLIANSWMEPAGSPIADPNTRRLLEPDKFIDKLRKKDNLIIERILKELVKLNGLTIKGQADAKNDSSEASSAASPTVLH